MGKMGEISERLNAKHVHRPKLTNHMERTVGAMNAVKADMSEKQVVWEERMPNVDKEANHFNYY